MTSERYDEGGARDAVASEEILVSPDLILGHEVGRERVQLAIKG